MPSLASSAGGRSGTVAIRAAFGAIDSGDVFGSLHRAEVLVRLFGIVDSANDPSERLPLAAHKEMMAIPGA